MSITPTDAYTHPAAPPDAIAGFNAIVAGFDDLARCEMPTSGGAGQCRRPARWRMDLHGCERMIVCGQHKAHWVRRAQYRQRCGRILACWHCRRRFGCVTAILTVVAI